MNNWWKRIPVCINNSYGDPFTDIQIMDTYDKARKLYEAGMNFCICTKAVPSKEAWDVISQLGNIPKERMIIEYSLTGLDEGGFSFEDRKEAIEKIYEIFGQVAIMMRPLIAGKNDTDENLQRIVDVATKTGKKVIIGGVHDENKRKQFEVDTINKIKAMCDEAGVAYFFKTSCTAANQFGIPCWMHDLGEAENLDIAQKLGYDIYTINDNGENKVVVKEATTGDLNFLRILTGAKIYTTKLINNYNILSFSTEDHVFECTSSWFSWSNNVPCSIACNYCIIRKIEYLLKNRSIGCFPPDLLDFVKKTETDDIIETCKDQIKIKYIKDDDITNLICYENLRTIQVCEAH